MLLSLQQDLSFFMPRCCVQNYAFVFLSRQSCELSSCTLSYERRHGLKSPAIAGGSRQWRKRADGRMFVHVLRTRYCIMFSCCQRISEVQLRHRNRWHRPLAESQFCILVQQDGEKKSDSIKGRKSYRAKKQVKANNFRQQILSGFIAPRNKIDFILHLFCCDTGFKSTLQKCWHEFIINGQAWLQYFQAQSELCCLYWKRFGFSFCLRRECRNVKQFLFRLIIELQHQC